MFGSSETDLKGTLKKQQVFVRSPRSRKTKEICIPLHFVLCFLAGAGAGFFLIHSVRLSPLLRWPCLFTFHQLPGSHLRREELLP